MFTGPFESLLGDAHFVLDSTVAPVQCAPRNVPVALKAAVKAQLDQYEKDGHLITVTQHTDWISNLVIGEKNRQIEALHRPETPQPGPETLSLSHAHFTLCAVQAPESTYLHPGGRT